MATLAVLTLAITIDATAVYKYISYKIKDIKNSKRHVASLRLMASYDVTS